jgi:hypothetical protein
MPAGNRYCFVIGSANDSHFNELYNELFRVAIEGAQLTPLRPDAEAASMTSVAQQIGASAACFADLSQENASTWFAVGCAVALGKPLCLISSTAGAVNPLVAGLEGLITYPVHSLPSDYRRLQQQITNQLLFVVPAAGVAARVPLAEPKDLMETILPTPVVAASVPLTKFSTITEVIDSNDLQLAVRDIRVHELLALSIICAGPSLEGMTLRLLAQEMNKHGVAQATSLSINGLCRKRLVERRLIPVKVDGKLYDEECLFVTVEGQRWIDENRENLNLSYVPPSLTSEPTGLMEYIASI